MLLTLFHLASGQTCAVLRRDALKLAAITLQV